MKKMKSINNNVGADTISDQNGNKGITLIALIITIVVMLILVIVSVRIALDTGLFESAGKATKDWEETQDREAELGAGKVTIGGVEYDSIEDYTNSISGGNAEVDFEKLFATAGKHPEQTESNDIGIAEDGSIVNLDLWIYEMTEENAWSLTGNEYSYISSYDETKIVDGKITGEVPMFIKKEDEEFYPVVSMYETFAHCEALVYAPRIPSTVTEMYSTFYYCTSLVDVSEIPSSVTDMSWTFYACTSLTKAPVIPNSVKNMESTFSNCTSLTEAPEIPNSVTDMWSTFSDCTSLIKAPVIPSSVTNINLTFSNCTSLIKAPVIPSSVNEMGSTFMGCTSLTEAPVIPSSVTNINSTFSDCTSLIKAPVIPSSVNEMDCTFMGCTSLTEAPAIPNSVTWMYYTFNGCTSLTGTLTINANPTTYTGCLENAATAEGCNLVLNGSSTVLNEILETAKGNPNITIGN